MPDVHSGYGFCIGNVAAFDMDDPVAVVSPGKYALSRLNVFFVHSLTQNHLIFLQVVSGLILIAVSDCCEPI